MTPKAKKSQRTQWFRRKAVIQAVGMTEAMWDETLQRMRLELVLNSTLRNIVWGRPTCRTGKRRVVVQYETHEDAPPVSTCFTLKVTRLK